MGQRDRSNLTAGAIARFVPGIGIAGGALSAARGGSFREGFVNPREGILGTEAARQRAAQQQSELESSFNAVPAFQSITDQSGQLREGFSAFDSSPALRALRDRVNAGGQTETGQRQLELNSIEGQRALDGIAASGQANLNQGFSALASRGGLRSGTRERLVANQANQNIQNRQNQRFLNNQQRIGILANDGDRQRKLLGTLADAQLGDRTLRINDLAAANQDAIRRSAAIAESRLNSQNAPQGGLGGFFNGLIGRRN